MPSIQTHYFALTVVRLGRRFLIVHERKHGQRWYLPAGRVEIGERLEAAAVRETLEETGVRVAIEGVLRVEHELLPDASARCRVFYVARPVGDEAPLATPNEDALEARWVTLEELVTLPLRSPEVYDAFAYVERGGTIHPRSVITREGTPWN